MEEGIIRKKLLLIAVILLIIILPTNTAFCFEIKDKIANNSKNYNSNIRLDWISGNFSGYFGIEEANEFELLGYFNGQFQKRNYFGLFSGNWNSPENDTKGSLKGIFIGSFTFGKISTHFGAIPIEQPFFGYFEVDDFNYNASVFVVLGFIYKVIGYYEI